MPWAAAGAVVGGLLSSSSSKKAAKAQAKSADAASQAQLTATRESNALQEKIFNQQRNDSAPWINTGEGALNQLAWQMGITPTSRIQAGQAGTSGKTRQDFYNELLASGKYTTQGSSAYRPNTAQEDYEDQVNGGDTWGTLNSQGGYGPLRRLANTAGSSTDFAALNAEADRVFAGQGAQGAQGYQGAPGDFGSLSRNFTMADRDADPVYQSGLQFGLNEGRKGYERQGAASGMQLSGATLKALTRFGNDYGSTKAQGAYERFGTNQATKFNRLSAIAGTGQQQVNQIGAAGQNYAGSVGANTMNAGNNIASNTIGAGNARAGSYMATANAFNNAIGTGINAWQQNKYLNSLGSNNMQQPAAPVVNRNSLAY